MKRFSVMVLPAMLAAGLAGTAPSPAMAAEASASAAAQGAQWKIWGGEANFRWNRSGLVHYGIQVSPVIGGNAMDDEGRERIGIRAGSSLDFAVDGGSFAGFLRGSLGLSGGFDLTTPNGVIRLRNPRLVPRADNAFRLDLVADDGVAWFYIDRLMYEVEGGSQAPVLAIKAADLRASATLADFVGNAGLEGEAVADVSMVNTIGSDSGDPGIFEPQGSSSKWPGMAVPGVPGATYQADVFMHHFSTQIMRQGADYFDPLGGHKIVLAPSSTLRNNRSNGTAQVTVPCVANDCDPWTPAMLPEPELGTSDALYSADVVWRQKFTGPSAPYGDDQHPYLIWNLYRIDADDRIEQIGRSGVKHAWLTTNSYCDANPWNGHILGLGCMDTYGTNNNDTHYDLGPRSEIIPATGEWGRCRSVFDKDCNGAMDNGAPCVNLGGNNVDCREWSHRMAVPAQQLGTSGATYLTESWYIVREDINIYNTMQTRGISFGGSGTSWNRTDGVSDDSDAGLKLGPAIDRWMPRGTNTVEEGRLQRSSDIIQTDENAQGQARLAVRATRLESGLWRYDYVLANFDYAVADIEYEGGDTGNPAKLRVLSNAGFTGFEVMAQTGTPAVAVDEFSDGDLDSTNDWGFSQTGDLLSWAPTSRHLGTAASNTLDWGTMFRFSVQSEAEPMEGVVTLKAPNGIEIEVQTLVPAGSDDPGEPGEPEIFEDGFEEEEVVPEGG